MNNIVRTQFAHPYTEALAANDTGDVWFEIMPQKLYAQIVTWGTE